MRIKILCGLCLCLLLAACGKISKPIPPEDSVYPQTYAVTQDAE